MTKLRIRMSLMLAWLLLVYYVERVDGETNGTRFAYLLATSFSLSVVGLQRWYRVRLDLLLLAATIVWVGGGVYGWGSIGASLGWIVTELMMVQVTIGLAWWLGLSINELEAGASEVSYLHHGGRILSLASDRVELERELQRAQRFQRPLALLRLQVDVASAAINLSEPVEEVQRGAAQQYQDHQVAQLIDEMLRDCDLAAQRDDHFVVLLTEMTRDESDKLVAELKRRAARRWGVELMVGVSAFPSEEVTLTGLLARAESALRADRREPAGLPLSSRPES